MDVDRLVSLHRRFSVVFGDHLDAQIHEPVHHNEFLGTDQCTLLAHVAGEGDQRIDASPVVHDAPEELAGTVGEVVEHFALFHAELALALEAPRGLPARLVLVETLVCFDK